MPRSQSRRKPTRLAAPVAKAVAAALEHSLTSARRTMALHLGQKQGQVSRQELWDALQAAKVITPSNRRGAAANLVRDMRLDAKLFVGDHKQGWRLTAAGRRLAREVAQGAPALGLDNPTRTSSKGYLVEGPFDIPASPTRVGVQFIDRRSGVKFWRTEPQSTLARERGCYLFCVRTGGGIMPWYVGMTASRNGFVSETFTDHKLTKYNRALAEYRRGTPVMFLVFRRSLVNEEEIAEIEEFLIGCAYEANPQLRNVRRRGRSWAIEGITAAAPRNHAGARTLRSVLHL